MTIEERFKALVGELTFSNLILRFELEQAQKKIRDLEDIVRKVAEGRPAPGPSEG